MSTQAFKRKLTGSLIGDAVLVTATSGTGTLIHTATSSTLSGIYDEIWIWAYNDSTADVTLSVQYGGVEDYQTFVVSVPHRCGLVPIIPGLLLQGSGTVHAYASEGSVVTLIGFVHALADS
jgi:hypothetical protein